MNFFLSYELVCISLLRKEVMVDQSSVEPMEPMGPIGPPWGPRRRARHFSRATPARGPHGIPSIRGVWGGGGTTAKITLKKLKKISQAINKSLNCRKDIQSTKKLRNQTKKYAINGQIKFFRCLILFQNLIGKNNP